MTGCNNIQKPKKIKYFESMGKTNRHIMAKRHTKDFNLNPKSLVISNLVISQRTAANIVCYLKCNGRYGKVVLTVI